MNRPERRIITVERRGPVASGKDFAELVRPLIGLPVSHAWRGAGTAIFLELGPLRDRGPRGRNLRGIGSVMIEFSWRVEKARSIAFGAGNGRRKIEHGIQTLVGRTIEEIAWTGRLPEISIRLSGARWVHTFMIEEGLPMWALFLPDGAWLCVRRGVIFHEREVPLAGPPK